MKIDLHPLFLGTAQGEEAEAIVRSCVHCGFCTATCPTYQLLGDERDGPRGRIYLIKQLLEEGSATEKTRTHLDRCLTCRACETTCPSGVQYGRLADIGREIMEQQQRRPWRQRLVRWGMRQVLPYAPRFTPLLRIGHLLRPLLPAAVANKIPARQIPARRPQQRHARVMLALAGCVQPGATPNTNIAAARVLDKLGITLLEPSGAGCCGALSYHLSQSDEGLDFARRNIDSWWPLVEQGAEAVVVTASGCGVMVKEYGRLLAADPVYGEKAKAVSALTLDLSEVVAAEDLSVLQLQHRDQKIAVHCPCSLQHGQQLPDTVNNILASLGFPLAQTRDSHLCCGSAGTYSILQPALSQQLLANKVAALRVDNPHRIVTANVGCQLHLGSAAGIPVQHWIEIIDEALVADAVAPD
ncbi:glycolate oxidase subunit GlcF [Pseudomaricurvus alcaniphilus]|uniref:glycolate oxidase subunit GlcF n=1 Tax=Pseudomaricurvus alcaniphilus TaxID=1166482 RepID=UPI00140D5587|nr:glycolate oxidase subunit GlcF [Pseudomaricurvus alcaniphilus]NHN38457.1 glycolate oxidase subunit GlcF [Pseudomaricurvus alcaniphilus]